MAFSEIELKKIDKFVGSFCRMKTPEEHKDELKFEYRIKGHDVLIVEIHPLWRKPKETNELEVAKIKFNRTRNTWQLYWQKANLKWFKYETENEINDLSRLVKEIKIDEFGCFFG